MSKVAALKFFFEASKWLSAGVIKEATNNRMEVVVGPRVLAREL